MIKENELKSLIESVVKEIVQEQNSTQSDVVQKSGETESVNNTNESKVSDESLADITKIDIRKELYVPQPEDKTGYMDMKKETSARIGVWRAGSRYKTSSSLRFKADHAAAQDAVFSYVDENFIDENGFISISTKCEDKDEYITRPDLGRQFFDETRKVIKNECGSPTVQIVIGDGLSSAAIEANALDTLAAIKQRLRGYGNETGKELFVKHCRVRAMDVVGDETGADVVCVLIGERPGLVTAESMSAYLCYKPTVGMPEARMTVISNIHEHGIPAVEAGAHIAEVIKKMIDQKASGLDLE